MLTDTAKMYVQYNKEFRKTENRSSFDPSVLSKRQDLYNEVAVFFS